MESKPEQAHHISPAVGHDGEPNHTQPGVGYGVHDRVHRGDHEHDQVCDEEPVQISNMMSQKSVKPKDWKLVKKRGIVPDGLVQSKLLSFMQNFPHLVVKGGGGQNQFWTEVMRNI